MSAMDATDSVSKGFFIHLPKRTNKKNEASTLDPSKYIASEKWYGGYKTVWLEIERQIRSIYDEVMKTLLHDVSQFVSDSPSKGPLIPTVLLLTGVNLPDHSSLFSHLISELTSSVTSYVAVLSSCDCATVKQTVEQIVAQLTKKNVDKQLNGMEISSEDSEPEDSAPATDEYIKKSDCTMPFLAKWYAETLKFAPPVNRMEKPIDHNNKKLVIIFKDFEGFQQKLLHRLILILSEYFDRLPIVLIFGVSTTEAALGEALTHQIISRLMLKVFQSQPSVYFLNDTINKVFLNGDCPFQLSGKLFKFFTDVFLFYDFSVNRFIRGIKYCFMDHCYGRPHISLLCQNLEYIKVNKVLKHSDILEGIRNIPSFKKHMENNDDKLLSDNKATKKEVLLLLESLRLKVYQFYACLNILHILVKDLPQSPLGKQLRELYCTAMSKDITKTVGYKNCHQLLNLICKDDLMKKIVKIRQLMDNISQENMIPDLIAVLDQFKTELTNVGLNPQTRSPVKSPSKIDLNVKNRSQLKQRLAEISSKPQTKFGYEALREKIVNFFMCELFPDKLISYTEQQCPLWEVITLQDIDARNRVVPRIRAPIHTALNNPHHYLQCKCCSITDENSILSTMPDICIAYKLHLEGGSIINIYDWLQSFSMIVDSQHEKKNIEDVDEKVQARFTQALAELEFLGFIKSSRSKPDHVSRLTWGSNT